jgi:hypothetical protein
MIPVGFLDGVFCAETTLKLHTLACKRRIGVLAWPTINPVRPQRRTHIPRRVPSG